MTVVYLVLLTVAGILLLLDAFSATADSRGTTRRFAVRLLPLALFFWVLVPWIQFAKAL